MVRRNVSRLIELSLGRLLTVFNEVRARDYLSQISAGDYFVKPEPIYVDQLAGTKKKLIDDCCGTIRDRGAMKKFGAKDLSEFSFWAWRSCGIVALQMVLKGVLGRKFNKSTMGFVKEGLAVNGYDLKGDLGWYHASLLKLARMYGLRGGLYKYMSVNCVAKLVVKNNCVLASVESPAGGHFVVVYGVRLSGGGKVDGFWIHNPSSYSYQDNGGVKYIKGGIFRKMFKNRAVVIYL